MSKVSTQQFLLEKLKNFQVFIEEVFPEQNSKAKEVFSQFYSLSPEELYITCKNILSQVGPRGTTQFMYNMAKTYGADLSTLKPQDLNKLERYIELFMDIAKN